MFSLLSNIKARKDDSVEDTGNGTEEENTGSEEGEEDEEGEGKDDEEGGDEDVRKQMSSLIAREVLYKESHGEVSPRGPTLYPVIYHFDRKVYLCIPLIEKRYPFTYLAT